MTRTSLLLMLSVQAFSKDIHVRAFPAAVFSPDGASVYYVRSDIHANTRKRGSRFDTYARSTEIRFVSEAISIHKFDLASGTDEVITVLQRPPWVGTGQREPRNPWFDGEAAKMSWSLGGYLQYEVRQAWTSAVNSQGVRKTWRSAYATSDPKWVDLPADPFDLQPRTDVKYVISGSLEVITDFRFRYADLGGYFLALLDHDRRAVRILATGSDEARKRAQSFTYEAVLGYSQVRGPFKEPLQKPQ